MKLPKWMTTVTPVSKFLALSMLVIFPIIAFFFGRWYQFVQDRLDFRSQPLDDVLHITPDDVGTDSGALQQK